MGCCSISAQHSVGLLASIRNGCTLAEYQWRAWLSLLVTLTYLHHLTDVMLYRSSHHWMVVDDGSDGRIDLVIAGGSALADHPRWAVFAELKVGAAEGTGQTRKYAEAALLKSSESDIF